MIAEGAGDDERWMARAVDLGQAVRGTTSPNPWVGAVLVARGGPLRAYEGATAPPGGPHAEVAALVAAARDGAAEGATLYVTLEPCCHHGRTPPCVHAIVDAGVARVVVALADPDPKVSGRGLRALEAAGVEVSLGVGEGEARASLAPYLKHRTTGRPFVLLKLAATMDGATAAADGSSRWITGPEARADVHRLRARVDAVLVGAGTVRRDDPLLTARTDPPPLRQPLRVVLGRAPAGARVHPALELSGDLDEVLADLGRRGVLEVMVEGGPTVAGAFHRRGLVDRYLFYLAPALAGGQAPHLFAGPGPRSIEELFRARLVSVSRLGDDVKVELARG